MTHWYTVKESSFFLRYHLQAVMMNPRTNSVNTGSCQSDQGHHIRFDLRAGYHVGQGWGATDLL